MSLVIENGFKFKNKNLKNCINHLDGIKKEAEKISLNNILREYNIVNFLYKNKLLDHKTHEVFDIIVNSFDTPEKYKSLIPFTFKSYMYFHGDSIYTILDTLIEDHLKLVKPFTIEYYYYDNTDKPNNISEGEWERRRKVWTDIFNDRYSLEENSFVYNIVDKYTLYKNHDVFFNKLEKILNVLRKNKTHT